MKLNITIQLSPAVEQVLLGQHRELLKALQKLERRTMATQAEVDAILAQVTQTHDVAQALALSVDILNEEHASIEELIEELKTQNPNIDVSALQAKAAEAHDVVNNLRPAVLKGTPQETP